MIRLLMGVLLLPGLVWAQQVDVQIAVYHAEVDPVTGEPCGGEFSDQGVTDLRLLFDNIERDARDEQVNWPDRRFDTLAPGEGAFIEARLDWSPGNLALGVPAGLQSLYTVRLGWQDRDRLATDRIFEVGPHRIETPQDLWITRDGWSTRNPGRDFERMGVIVCNRPPAVVDTRNIFPDLAPGSVFLSWQHAGGLAEAIDWSHTEIWLLPEPRIVGEPHANQFAWGQTHRVFTELDCGTWYACYRTYDAYGHVTELCDGEVEVVDCGQMIEPDMAVPEPDMALPDMAVPDMAVPEPDMAEPDMALPEPDMALPEPDMAAPDMAAEPDMAAPDMAAEPDMAAPEPDMTAPEPDMALDAEPGDPSAGFDGDVLDAGADLDADTPDLEPGDPQAGFDMAADQMAWDAEPGDPQPEPNPDSRVGDTKDAATLDASTIADGGANPGTGETTGCTATPGGAPGWLLVLALGLRRRRED
jgi:hypothetical protein